MTVIASWTTMRALFAGSAPTFDADGVETWPYHMMRANGFDGGFSGIPSFTTGQVSFPATVSVDSLANGAEAFDVYLSQRTDDIELQCFAVDAALGKSGTWTIALTDRGCRAIGLVDGSGNPTPTAQLTTAQASQAARHCALYVKRRADGALQWIDLHKTIMQGL